LRDPRVKNQPSIKREDAHHNAIAWLGKEIRVESPDRRTGVFTVSLTSSDPNEAAAIVNAVVDTYMNECVNLNWHFQKVRLSEVEQLITEKENEVRTKREQLPADLERAKREDHELTEEREELKAGPIVRVLGDPNCPAVVPEHPD
jgi:hypothetical protein